MCTQSPSSLLEMCLDKLIKDHELALNELILACEEIHKFCADNKWQGQKQKHSSRQLAIAESLSLQEGLEQFQHKNEVYKAQDVLSIDPALSAVKLYV